ncbi:MAG: hypothetical protein GY898_33645 [Proteobacteria bacterium]|nr:hypothetical protein [Pseudomonadota bacterium]
MPPDHPDYASGIAALQLAARLLDQALEVPDRMTLGAGIDYVVSLSGPGGGAVRTEHQPDLRQILVDVDAARHLTCRAAKLLNSPSLMAVAAGQGPRTPESVPARRIDLKELESTGCSARRLRAQVERQLVRLDRAG